MALEHHYLDAWRNEVADVYKLRALLTQIDDKKNN